MSDVTMPETGDLWEYIPYGKLYFIMERIPEIGNVYMILSLDNGKVMQYDFSEHLMDLWRKAV